MLEFTVMDFKINMLIIWEKNINYRTKKLGT